MENQTTFSVNNGEGRERTLREYILANYTGSTLSVKIPDGMDEVTISAEAILNSNEPCVDCVATIGSREGDYMDKRILIDIDRSRSLESVTFDRTSVYLTEDIVNRRLDDVTLSALDVLYSGHLINFEESAWEDVPDSLTETLG